MLNPCTGRPSLRAVKTTVNDLAKSCFFCTPPKGPCTPVRRPQTRCPGLPAFQAAKTSYNGSIDEDIIPCETKFSSLLSEVSSMQCNAPSRPTETVRSKLQKTVNRALCGCELAQVSSDLSRLVRRVRPCTNLALLEPRPITVTGRFFRSFGKNPAFTGLLD